MSDPAQQSETLVPTHIAIIMDGNGRWAAARNLPRVAGHKQGMEAVRAAISGAAKEGVGFLTLYAFSAENWKRPEDEVRDLMGLLRLYIGREVKALHKKGIRVRFIGDRTALAEDIQAMMADAEALTQHNAGMTVLIALNYGGQQEIAMAARVLAQRAVTGEIEIDAIDATAIGRALYTADVPDPDLIIRTSGEQRLSNFLLWQAAYSEFLFLDVLWPDFTEDSLSEAVEHFAGRERRFGARKA